jgi:Family of unknown function (DUF5709)
MSDDLYEGGFEGGDQIDPSETLTGDDTEDPLDFGYTPPEREPHGTRYGTTAEEQFEGETLEQRLAEEEPDVEATSEDWFDDEPDRRAGRLVAPDEGAHPDVDEDETAEDVGLDGLASSAEEAAVHIQDDERY